ncbi:hypothetical protein [Thalassolituus oleivorans]|uniref:hypothetical protein n=1 Tax=Thalassolituus oleivorans TaxID=187493 RepID=UPI00240A7291|nr:hypothetical protein [Thalassolituus oleivorans]MDF1641262.1 hypothetical protein [Thalassolituus oleivorans]
MKIVLISLETQKEKVAKKCILMSKRFNCDVEVVWPGSDIVSDCFRCINENYFLNKNDFIEKFDALGLNRGGWYYQQFLKYMVVLDSADDSVWIVDGDSEILNERIFDINTVFTTGNLVHAPYNNHIKKYMDGRLSSLSYVTNQMLFSRRKLDMMLREFYPGDWIHSILVGIDEENAQFSEYQTYAQYLLNLGLRSREIKVFRRMDLLWRWTSLIYRKYDVVSWESHKSGLLRVVRANIFYLFGRTLG